LFSLRVHGQSMPDDGITILDAGFESIHMTTNFVWWFVGGYCIRPTWGECHIFVSAQWDVYIPPPFTHEYHATYATEDGMIVYTIADVFNNRIVRIRFIPQPFN
jgi:hypothetical protein